MRRFIGFLTFAHVLLCAVPGEAQNYSVYNSYYINPYFYNPAEAATDYTFIHLNHRQQWVGFEGAPQVTTASFTTLFDETRNGIGVKISSYKRGLLQTNDFMATYAYGLPVSPKNTLYFGMSAGAVSNRIDVTGIDSNDPVLSTYTPDNIQPASNFGMLLRMESGINLGLALPQLFAPRFNQTSNFENTAVTPLDNMIISAYYRRKVEGKLVSRKKGGIRAKVKTKETNAPLEFYALYKYAKAGNSQAEATIKLNLSENFWLAGQYRQAYGFAGAVGFAFSKVLLNYSYEPGNQPQAQFSKGTHELHLGIRIGEQKRFKRIAPVLKSTIKSTGNEQHAARFRASEELEEESEGSKTEKKQYYVVVRAFPDFSAADAYKQKLLKDKYNANVYYYEKDKKYYVYIFESSKPADAHEEARNLKLYTKLKEVKVLTVVVPKK
jgi:type IX secretion system PorP/SprF family membrane protein